MKTLVLVAVSILFFACSKQIDDESFDFDGIELEATAIIVSDKIDMTELPISIANLKPEHLQLNELGLFIRLNSSFVSENGLFIPRIRTIDYSASGEDPEFKRLSKNVYRYSVRG